MAHRGPQKKKATTGTSPLRLVTVARPVPAQPNTPLRPRPGRPTTEARVAICLGSMHQASTIAVPTPVDRTTATSLAPCGLFENG